MLEGLHQQPLENHPLTNKINLNMNHKKSFLLQPNFWPPWNLKREVLWTPPKIGRNLHHLPSSPPKFVQVAELPFSTHIPSHRSCSWLHPCCWMMRPIILSGLPSIPIEPMYGIFTYNFPLLTNGKPVSFMAYLVKKWRSRAPRGFFSICSQRRGDLCFFHFFGADLIWRFSL